MRKLTANEINEITDVFEAVLEACTTRTAGEGKECPIDGEIVDLGSLPRGTGICWPRGNGGVGNAFKTDEGWLGDYPKGGATPNNGFLASILTQAADEGNEAEFVRGPYSSPAGSVTFENEEELYEAFVENKSIDFGSYELSLDGWRATGGDVIVVNGSSSFQVTASSAHTGDCWIRFEDGFETHSPEGNVEAITEYFPSFPLRFEVYPNPFTR